MVSQNFPKCFKSCPLAWNPTGKKQIYMNRRRSYMNRHICKLFHFALSLLNSEIAITPERVARLTWFFGSMPKSKLRNLIFSNNWFWPTGTKVLTVSGPKSTSLIAAQIWDLSFSGRVPISVAKCLLEQVRRRKIFEYKPDQQTALRSLIVQVWL